MMPREALENGGPILLIMPNPNNRLKVLSEIVAKDLPYKVVSEMKNQRIKLFFKILINSKGKLFELAKTIKQGVEKELNSFDASLFSVVNFENEADIIVTTRRSSTMIKNKDLTLVRRGCLLTKWDLSKSADKLYESAKKVIINKDFMFTLINFDGEHQRRLKNVELNRRNPEAAILCANGFLKECAYILNYKAIMKFK